MNIQILNNDLSLYGIVTGYEALDFVRSWSSKGSFKIAVNANNKNAKYIKVDKILYIDQNKIGYIDKITIDRKTDKAGEYIYAEGVELKDRLNRIIYPDSGLVSDSYVDEKVETIVKSLIQKNAGSLAASARQIPNLITAPNQYRGTEAISYSARYKDLSAEIYSLLSSQQLGLKATIDLDNANIVFDVAQGTDLTASQGQAGGIVLSLDTKTALQITDTDDRLSYKNLSVTAGLGEGADREILEVGTSAIGYGRREVFTEAKDIESNTELETRGKQKLSEISKTRGVTAKANNLGSYQVEDDYDLGDIISADANGELYNAQITKLKYKFSKDQIPQIDVVLNFDVEDTLITDIQAKHMDYEALKSYEEPEPGPINADTLDGKDGSEYWSYTNNRKATSKSYSANTNFALSLAEGETALITFSCNNSSGDIYMYVNGDTRYGNYYRCYTYDGTSSIYTSGCIVSNSNSSSYAAIIHMRISVIRGRIYYSGIDQRGRSDHRAGHFAHSRSGSSLSSIRFTQSGELTVVKL